MVLKMTRDIDQGAQDTGDLLRVKVQFCRVSITIYFNIFSCYCTNDWSYCSVMVNYSRSAGLLWHLDLRAK